MIYFTFIIPVVFCTILFCFFRNKTVWWEYLCVFIPSIVVSIIVNLLMINYNTSSTEYFGYYANSVKHYDAWNEYIHRTCTRQVPCGTDGNGHTRYRTETYDCSYVKYHKEYWVAEDNTNNDRIISKIIYDSFRYKWKAPMVFIDMKRKYHSLDGDAQKYEWNKSKLDILSFTDSHRYKNKIKSAKSLFGFSEVTKDKAIEIGLFEYPELTNLSKYDSKNQQSTILGINCTESEQKFFQYINSYYGLKNEFRTYLLFFKNKDRGIMYDQRDYWVGGNKNEFVVCFGIDSITNKILWCDAFSWCDKPKMETEVRSYFSNKDTLNLTDFGNNIEEWVCSGLWQRKSFKDYEYLSVELTSIQYTWLIIITFIINILIGFWVILNRYEDRCT